MLADIRELKADVAELKTNMKMVKELLTLLADKVLERA